MPWTVMRVPSGSCSSATSSSVAGPADLPVETGEALGLVKTISPERGCHCEDSDDHDGNKMGA